jgi:hypothetical protein
MVDIAGRAGLGFATTPYPAHPRYPAAVPRRFPLRLARRDRSLVWLLGLAVASLGGGVAHALPRTDISTSAGLIGMTVTNLGYFGNGLTLPNQPSCEYPRRSHVEHIFLGGLWVGAITNDGSIRVVTGAQDAASLADGDLAREFTDTTDPADQAQVWSNRQNANNYNPAALATEHIQVVFNDAVQGAIPIGLKVVLRALDWGNPYADDFVILDYSIINTSGTELRDVYAGLWIDTTVGNTEQTNPYDPAAPVRWNYYDDANGAWGPSGEVAEALGLPEGHIPAGSQVLDDQGIWMTYEHDADGELGLATSWVGTRLLGTAPAPSPELGVPPVSYNAWTFRHVPAQDSWYREFEVVGNDTVWAPELSPGKYQIMGNGAFTVGQTQTTDYTIPSDWIGLLATGPFPFMAPGDTVHATFAVVCAADSSGLLANSRVAQVAYEDQFAVPTGPPSPILDVAYDWNSVILRWVPGIPVEPGTQVPLADDDPRRSPEFHISKTTGRLDFQGYRVLRYRGAVIGADPYTLADIVAEYDIVDGVGFDTGLPPLDAEGRRVFTLDTDLLDGFPYWYAVISFSAPDVQEGLPSFESGFYENAILVYPGSPPPASGAEATVNVVPNPYRGGSTFDNPRVSDPELGRKIWFTNLPPHCSVKVFTVSGDLVRSLSHQDPDDGKLSWDLLSDFGRATASGLYIYVVENLDSGEIQRGKLVIIK